MTMIASLFCAGLVFAAPTVDDYLPKGLQDVSFTARIVRGNYKELAKINDDFANSYRFKSSKVWLKEPFKLRMESVVEDASITFIVNGPRKKVRIPRSNINLKEDLSRSPGKRQTLLDFGLIAPSLFDNYFQAKFVREDRATKDVVFDVTYVPSLKDGTRHRLWIDPERRMATKREWYSQIDGRLMATFVYEQPVKSDGIWFPTQVTVRNADNVVAGITRYEKLSVNVGLSESLFKID